MATVSRVTSTSLDDARAALRQRQGAGARYDAEGAPHTELAWARTGTAYFARKLGELGAAELDGPSLLPGWNRRALIAHVGYNARALTRLCEWARTGFESPMYESTQQRDAEIANGATLPDHALVNLFKHSEVHLNVEWRDLPDQAWDAPVRTAQGRTVPARETAWMRTREVWVHTVDLATGATFRDFPPELLNRLATDVVGLWQRRDEQPDLTLEPTDHGEPIVIGAGTAATVTGRLADLTQWLTGRGTRGLHTTDNTGTTSNTAQTLPILPRWI